jgi:hypothetical protein
MEAMLKFKIKHRSLIIRNYKVPNLAMNVPPICQRRFFLKRMKPGIFTIPSIILAQNITNPETVFPSESETFIKGIIYGGSGCRQGTVASSFSTNLTSFTIIYDEFIAASGVGTTIRDSRKNCQINVDLRYPIGWSYSVTSVDYRGFISIPDNTLIATQSSTCYFSGETAQSTTTNEFHGPFTGNYIVSEKLLDEERVWSPCGKVIMVNINAKVSLSGDLSLPALISVDSTDLKVEQKYGIEWRKC